VPTWYVEARTTEIVKIPHRCNSALFHAVLSVGAKRSSVGGDGVVLTGGGWCWAMVWCGVRGGVSDCWCKAAGGCLRFGPGSRFVAYTSSRMRKGAKS
jgi:hypothetical protein